MNVSLTSFELFLALSFLAILILSVPILVRILLTLNNSNKIRAENKGLANRTKYPSVNVFRWRGVVFRFSLAIAIAFALVCMSWTTYEIEHAYELGPPIQEDLPIIPVVPEFPKPKLEKPKPQIIEEVIEEEIPEEQDDMIDMDIEDDEYIEPVPAQDKSDEDPSPYVPPKPEEEVVEVEEIWRFVEEMPIFPGCEGDMSKEERKLCSDKNLLMYLSKHLKYPSVAKENNIQGRVYIEFVIGTDGSVQDIAIVRNIGAGCGKAAQKVVESMNNMPQKWVPGKQQGKKVKVKYTLPITFKLQ